MVVLPGLSHASVLKGGPLPASVTARDLKPGVDADTGIRSVADVVAGFVANQRQLPGPQCISPVTAPILNPLRVGLLPSNTLLRYNQ